jgi:uncharacterized integral membrane protein
MTRHIRHILLLVLSALSLLCNAQAVKLNAFPAASALPLIVGTGR